MEKTAVRKNEKKSVAQKKQTSKKAKPKKYVMYGFEEANPDSTAYLKIELNGNIAGPYSAVLEASEATVFTTQRRKRGGTPRQWEKFFQQEEELQGWNFHLVPIA